MPGSGRGRSGWCRRDRDEAGFTAVEVSIAVALLGIVMALCTSALVSMNNGLSRADSRSQSSDQARLAIVQIDRQVRSGNILYDPAAENDAAHSIWPGLSVRIYTQTNAVQRCVQWRIRSQQLETRSWSESWQFDGNVSAWKLVATDIVNTTSTPAFVRDAASGFGNRLLDVDLRVNHDPTAGHVVQEKAAIAGRNTEYGYDPSVCNTIPPY